MGRTEASRGLAPPSVRKDQRAKHAKATINQVIPKMLASSARARDGVASSLLIVDPAKPHQSAVAKGPRSKSAEQGDLARPKLRLLVTDTISAAQLMDKDPISDSKALGAGKSAQSRVGILNMASPLRPGGGVLTGAQAQEEFLCLRTTLLPSLKEEFYRLPEVGGVLTKDVLVFRDGEGNDLPKSKRFFVDVVSAGTLRFPETQVVTVESGVAEGKASVPVRETERALVDSTETDLSSSNGESNEDESDIEADVDALGEPEAATKAIYSNDKDRELVIRKIRAVLRVFQRAGVTKVVCGAWGCGAYGNPVGEVAAAWNKVFNGNKGRPSESWAMFEDIVFAINDSKMAGSFAQAFGDDLEVTSLIKNTTSAASDAAEVGSSGEVEELTAKIAELEMQRTQTRIPDLSARIGVIVEGLRETLAQKQEQAQQT